jgi:molybdopterin synthase sulfur carrier subunit
LKNKEQGCVMNIRVKGYFTFKKIIGGKAVLKIDIEKATIKDVLKDLSKKFGQDFKEVIFDPKTQEISSHIRILVNGRHYQYLPDRLNTELKEGDEVALFPPIAGG